MVPDHMRRGFARDGGAPDYLLYRSWTRERYEQGINTDFPRPTVNESFTHNYQPSTLWLKNANYIRLKNVELGYNFSHNLLIKIGIGSARIYLNGNNLVTWANLLPGMDPESASGVGDGEPYPATRLFNIGLNINF